MTIRTGSPARSAADSADERWAQWIAKGVEQDRVTRGRIAGLAIVFVCGLAAWLALATFFG